MGGVFYRHVLSLCSDGSPFLSLSWYGHRNNCRSLYEAMLELIVSPCRRYSAGFFTALLPVLLLVCLVTTPESQGAEEVYRCEDGSFTNRLDAGCTPYRIQGSVTVSPDGQPPAIIRDRVKSDTSIMIAVLPPPSGKISKTGYTLCGLYDEWQALRRTTRGGIVFQRGRDVARWQALSRMFLDVGTPQCEVLPVVQAAQASR